MTRAQRTNAALAEIAAERERQVNVEGWTEAHDDEHKAAQMAHAAGCYALWGSPSNANRTPLQWPWDRKWWKSGDRRRSLVKAGALIVAELERRDRLANEQPVGLLTDPVVLGPSMRPKNPSSNIEGYAYDVHTSTLEIRFSGGGVYRYFKVPANVVAAFGDAESAGKFFFAEIKGKFNHEKLKESA
jgi:hypothetical protein